MSTLKNVQMLLSFWFHKNGTVLQLEILICMFAYIIFIFVAVPKIIVYFSFFVLLFIYMFLLWFSSEEKIKKRSKLNYFVSIYEAKKVQKKLIEEKEEKFCFVLDYLIKKSDSKKDSMALNNWIENYSMLIKCQRDLEKKKRLVQTLEKEIVVMDKTLKALSNTIFQY